MAAILNTSRDLQANTRRMTEWYAQPEVPSLESAPAAELEIDLGVVLCYGKSLNLTITSFRDMHCYTMKNLCRTL